MSARPAPRRIVILGGGTAGWMAANLLQHEWGGQGTAITLIESPAIGIIGVGEGSTPQLKAFFEKIGVSEAEWMPHCNATYKAGIEFVGWSDKPGFETYFHPFPTQVDRFTEGQFFYSAQARRAGFETPGHPDPFFLDSRIATEGKAPLAPANFPFHTSYGYHFDAHLVGAALRAIAVSRGVTHAAATIREVELTESGDVAALIDEEGRRFEGDLFLDASGFRATIIEGALGEKHISFADNLFNDSAVVAPTPLPAGGAKAQTTATAKSAGWIWHIPLTTRAGNGYVYSSRFIDPEAAAAELREHVGLAADAEVRHLTMRCGRVERSWVRNCLAIGLAQGFLEPLEATALHIVLATVEGFVAAWEKDDRAGFNAAITRRYEGIRDYIVCHYRTAQRRDTDYWRAATSHDRLSDSLKGLITTWFTGADLIQEIHDQGISDIYPPLSWHCLLGGYGNYPDPIRLRPPGADVRRIDMSEIDRFVGGCAMNFPTHAEALARLDKAALAA